MHTLHESSKGERVAEEDSYLETRKTQLQSQCGNPIARLFNISASLESLRRNAPDIIVHPDDAGNVEDALSSIIIALGDACERVQNGRDGIGNITFIENDGSKNE
jgi:hypothetical protein